MVNRIEQVKDANGRNCLAVRIDSLELHGRLTEMRSLVDRKSYDLMTEAQAADFGGEYHISVIDAAEYDSFVKSNPSRFVEALQAVFDYEIDDVVLAGLVSEKLDGFESYYVVCESEKLRAVRTRFGLATSGFHVTLGYQGKDVAGAGGLRTDFEEGLGDDI